MLKRINIALVSISLFFLLGLAYAAEARLPFQLTAEQLSLDQTSRRAVFLGAVEIKQDTMLLEADKVTVYEDQQGYRYAEGEGKPVKFQHKTEAGEPLLAQALRFTYNEKIGVLTLYDEVWVKQGEDEVSSDIIVYDIKQAHYSAKTQENRRVNMVFSPKKKNTERETP